MTMKSWIDDSLQAEDEDEDGADCRFEDLACVYWNCHVRDPPVRCPLCLMVAVDPSLWTILSR